MYDYLKKYILNEHEGSRLPNNFWPVSQEEIDDFEQKIGIAIPSELKIFYQEIGYGFLTHTNKHDAIYDFCDTNRIIPPPDLADIILNGASSGLIMDFAFEDLSPGDFPIFEIGDSTRFMIMKPLSDNPNAVWFQGWEKIEDSFERFIYNLYYDDPAYYSRCW
jgi:hypothetical protein